jgi:hypothetical protein
MKNKKILTITTLIGLAVLLSLSPVYNSDVAAGDAPAGETVPYSGRLSNDAGKPVPDGKYAFSFALYDAAKDGNLLWSETQTGIDLKGGAFSVLLGSTTPLPQEARIKDGWLAVGVRGPGEEGFTALTPRQELNAANPTALSSPAAGPACPHDHFGEEWYGNSAGGVMSAGLKVENATSNHIGIYGVANNGPSARGVRGVSDQGKGVEGFSEHSFAVFGETGSVVGVYGRAAYYSGVGVLATHGYLAGTALEIEQGAFKVNGAGVNNYTTVFIQQTKTGIGGNICPAFTNATVIDHVLTNDDPNAILIVTLNGGTLGAGVGPANPYISVQYDANNLCGFGTRWVIFDNSGPMPNGTKFNVMVIKP